MNDLDLDVIEAMEKYGGSFVQALAVAASRADADNLAKIKATWPEYWKQYTDMIPAACDWERIGEKEYKCNTHGGEAFGQRELEPDHDCDLRRTN